MRAARRRRSDTAAEDDLRIFRRDTMDAAAFAARNHMAAAEQELPNGSRFSLSRTSTPRSASTMPVPYARGLLILKGCGGNRPSQCRGSAMLR